MTTEVAETIHPPSLENLISFRATLENITDRTWKRRMLLNKLPNTMPEVKSQLFTNPRNANLFSSDLDGIQIKQDSLLYYFTIPGEPVPIKTELFLLQKAVEDDSRIAEIRVSDLPTEIFARPGDKPEVERITAVVRENPNLTLEQYLQSNPSYVPMLETLLDAQTNHIQAEIGLRVLSDPMERDKYYKIWVQNEKNSGLRITRTPTYQSIIDRLRSLDRRDGRNRTIAKMIFYGSPGTGKSELVRVINGDKDTLVVSGRPYLSYEELVGGPKIISTDRKAVELALANALQQHGAPSVAQMLVNLADKHVEQTYQVITADGTVKSLGSEAVIELKKKWFLEMGFDQNSAKILSTRTRLEEPQALEAGGYLNPEYVKTTFITYLLEKAAEKTIVGDQDYQREREYMEGLFIVADKMGMNVMLDEAEKMFEGQIKGSESFAGLEDLLTRSPGSIIRIGNIEHRLSDDFGVAITMNTLTIPRHIISRFTIERTMKLEDKSYDRVAITAVDIVDTYGRNALAVPEQEKLAFLLTFIWPALEESARINHSSTSVDLRIMNALISTLAHDGRSTGNHVDAVLDGLRRDEVIGPILARYRGLAVSSDLNSLFNPGKIEESFSSSSRRDFFSGLLASAPTEVSYAYENRQFSLTSDQVKKLSQTDKPDTNVESDGQLLTNTGFITINNRTLIFSHPSDPLDVLHRVIVNRNIQGDPPIADNGELTLVTANAWGNVVVVKEVKEENVKYYAVDASGAYSGDLDPKDPQLTARRSSSIIQSSGETLPSFSLTPDGKFLFVINNNQLEMHRIGISKGDKGSVEIEQAIPLSSPDDPLESFTLSHDGNYALVKFRDGSVNVLNISEARNNRQASYLSTQNIHGYPDFQLRTFNNILYLFSPEKQKGLALY